jgi:hypothetical protein
MSPLAEEAFKTWLEDEGVTVAIHTGITSDRIPNSGQHIQCYAQSADRVVGPLYKVEMAIVIATSPSSFDDVTGDEEDALASHKALVGTVQDLVEGYDATDLDVTYGTVTGDVFSGAFLRDIQNGVDDARWVTTINFMFGARRS